jgi:hypothetical protein
MITPPFRLKRLIATKKAVEEGAKSENLYASACFAIGAYVESRHTVSERSRSGKKWKNYYPLPQSYAFFLSNPGSRSIRLSCSPTRQSSLFRI